MVRFLSRCYLPTEIEGFEILSKWKLVRKLLSSFRRIRNSKHTHQSKRKRMKALQSRTFEIRMNDFKCCWMFPVIARVLYGYFQGSLRVLFRTWGPKKLFMAKGSTNSGLLDKRRHHSCQTLHKIRKFLEFIHSLFAYIPLVLRDRLKILDLNYVKCWLVVKT